MTDNFDQAMYNEAVQRMESTLSQVPEFHMTFDTVWLEFMKSHGTEYERFAELAWKDHSERYGKLLSEELYFKENPPSESLLLTFHHNETVGQFRFLFKEKFLNEQINHLRESRFPGIEERMSESFILNSNKDNSLKHSLLSEFNNLINAKFAKVKKVYDSVVTSNWNQDFRFGCSEYFYVWLKTREIGIHMQYPFDVDEYYESVTSSHYLH